MIRVEGGKEGGREGGRKGRERCWEVLIIDV
jgi:hypothetical protein